MIDKLLQQEIDKSSSDKEVAVLLSGGVDSLSVAFAAQRLGKKITAYTFKLKDVDNYDSDKAIEVSKLFNWNYKLIEVPTDNLVDDFFKLLNEIKCERKTHFECCFPFLYVYPQIEQKEVLSGWAADGYYGVSKKALIHYTKDKPDTRFKEFRSKYFAYENRAGYVWHNRVAEKYNKKFITPYLTDNVKYFFWNKTWEELNKPFQKHTVVNAFEEFKKFKFKKHINLQLGSGVDKLFESLLQNSKVNPLAGNSHNDKKFKYKNITGIAQYWNKKGKGTNLYDIS